MTRNDFIEAKAIEIANGVSVEKAEAECEFNLREISKYIITHSIAQDVLDLTKAIANKTPFNCVMAGGYYFSLDVNEHERTLTIYKEEKETLIKHSFFKEVSEYDSLQYVYSVIGMFREEFILNFMNGVFASNLDEDDIPEVNQEYLDDLYDILDTLC